MPKSSSRLLLKEAGRSLRPALSLFSLAAVICAPASAALIYQTGSEPPTYSVGSLNGQDGWTSSTVPVVETSTVFPPTS